MDFRSTEQGSRLSLMVVSKSNLYINKCQHAAASHTDGPALIPEVIHKMPLLVPHQLHILIFHQGFPRRQLQPQKPLTVDRLEALLQMQRTDPFCNYISKCLLNGKAPQHEFDTFTHVKGLLYKHITDSGKQFLALVIIKS